MNRIVVFCCLCCFPILSTLSAPRLAVPPEGVAFGEIAAGEPASKSVELRNASPSPVTVSQVKGCCGAEASLSSMRIEPSSAATLSVSLKAMLPGEFSKHVQILCDDPESPVINIPVTGMAAESKTAAAVSHWTLPTVVLAGIVDGFNPCSFAIMISLAGILAIGGRKRKARIIGGLSFCIGTFVTYMLMGLGLMQALKALEGLRIVHDVVMVLLAFALFVLSFLSFRDAARFRKIPVFSVVTLKLPEGVKVLIRKIAMESWSGPAVALAGFGCAFLVTLLDALCTGQVYVPVLALISREPGAWHSFALLALYNLAFIAPLVAVFVLASKTTDAFQMAKWSSRNVVPAKIALGILFALLGALVLPRFGGRIADWLSPRTVPPPPAPIAAPASPVRVRAAEGRTPVSESRPGAADVASAVSVVCGAEPASAARYEMRNDALRTISRRRDLPSGDVAALMAYVSSRGGALRPEREAALRNDAINLLRRQEPPPDGLAAMLVGMAEDSRADSTLRDYALQHLGALRHDVADASVRTAIRSALVRAARDVRKPFAGTALYSLADDPKADAAELRRLALALLKPGANPVARLSAIQLAGERGYREALPSVREILRGPHRDAVTDIAAVGTLGLIGTASDARLVGEMREKGGERLRPAAETALRRIRERNGPRSQCRPQK